MRVTKTQASFQDVRGVIKDILFKEPIDHVTVITSAKGVVRGNHYHKETLQWVYLHSGRLKVLTRQTDGRVAHHILEEGDLVLTEKFEEHALEAMEDSVFFVFTRGPRGGRDYEQDTFRLDSPLRLPDDQSQ